jgi:hypothetical protein
MKRFFGHVLFAPLFLGAAALLGGCPIYGGHQSYCSDSYYDSDCSSDCSSSYDCPSGSSCSSYGRCVSATPPPPPPTTGTSCTQPADCPSGQSCGTDDKCHVGDCSSTGCPSGFVCKLESGQLQCTSVSATDGGQPFTGCKNDGACASKGTGAKCLNGDCVAAVDQCSDATQCPSGSQCVQGACTPSCDATKPCPTGFSCDLGKGVCSGNATPCGASSQCTSNTTCVDEHCVDPCGPGNTCKGGLVCVDGGCTPDEKPQFVCVAEGQKDACATGSICLHHSCYIGCSADAGATACQAADKFNQCKQVKTSTGTYPVCGSSGNLGTECDPTQSKNCASPLICIDGFCR